MRSDLKNKASSSILSLVETLLKPNTISSAAEKINEPLELVPLEEYSTPVTRCLPRPKEDRVKPIGDIQSTTLKTSPDTISTMEASQISARAIPDSLASSNLPNQPEDKAVPNEIVLKPTQGVEVQSVKKSSTGSFELYNQTPRFDHDGKKKLEADTIMVLSTGKEQQKRIDTFFQFRRGNTVADMSYVLPDGSIVLALCSLDGGEGCLKQTLLLVQRSGVNPGLYFHLVYNDMNKCKDLIVSKAVHTRQYNNFIRLKNTLTQERKFFDVLFLVNDFELLYYRSEHNSNCSWVSQISKYFVIYKENKVADIKDPGNAGMEEKPKRIIVDFQFVANGLKERNDLNWLQFAVLSKLENSYFLSFVGAGESDTEKSKLMHKKLYEIELNKELLPNLQNVELKKFTWSDDFSRVLLFGETDSEECVDAYVGDFKMAGIPELKQALEQYSSEIKYYKACQKDLLMYKLQRSEPAEKSQGGRIEFVEQVEEVGPGNEWTIAAGFEGPNTLATISVPKNDKPLSIQMIRMEGLEKEIKEGAQAPRMKGVAFSKVRERDKGNQNSKNKGKFVNVSLATSDGKILDIQIQRR